MQFQYKWDCCCPVVHLQSSVRERDICEMNLSLPLLFQRSTLFPIAYCSFDSNCMHDLLSLLNKKICCLNLMELILFICMFQVN